MLGGSPDSNALLGSADGGLLIADCSCCDNGQGCVCEDPCCLVGCPAFVCCVPCSLRATLTDPTYFCPAPELSAPSVTVTGIPASVCLENRESARTGSPCEYWLDDTSAADADFYPDPNCSGTPVSRHAPFSLHVHLNVGVLDTDGVTVITPARAIAFIVVAGVSVFAGSADQADGNIQFDLIDFPLTLTPNPTLLGTAAGGSGGSIELGIDCCQDCAHEVCPNVCGCCDRYTFTLENGEWVKFVNTAAAGQPCSYAVESTSSVNINGVLSCFETGTGIAYWSAVLFYGGGTNEFRAYPTTPDGCPPEDAAKWTAVSGDVRLSSVVCGERCPDCPSPDCSHCPDGSWFLSGPLPESGPDTITSIGNPDKCNQSFLQCSADVCVTVEIVCSGGTWTMTLTWTFTSGKVMVFQAPAILDPNGDADHADDCCWPADASRYTKTRDDFGSSIEIVGTDF